MNARRLHRLKACGAFDAHEVARQDVIADIEEHITLSTVDIARCVGDFGARNRVYMQVCAACGTRDPNDPCSHVVSLRELPASHWLRVLRLYGSRLPFKSHIVNFKVRKCD